MATKTEDRIKNLLTDFYDKKEKQIENLIIDRSLGIFFWGFIIGALFSYVSLLPLTIGLIFGITITKKNPLMLNTFLDKMIDLMMGGFKSISDGTRNDFYKKFKMNF